MPAKEHHRAHNPALDPDEDEQDAKTKREFEEKQKGHPEETKSHEQHAEGTGEKAPKVPSPPLPPAPDDPIRRDKTTTRPIDSTADKQADAAFVPSDLQELPGHRNKPWWKDDFREKIIAAGFPTTNVTTDEAFLQALYRFQGGTISEDDLKRDEAETLVDREGHSQPHSAPVSQQQQEYEKAHPPREGEHTKP
jgi:hypothetical protein